MVSALVVGLLSAAGGPMSIPFVAGYHLRGYVQDTDTPGWEQFKIGVEYGLGYYLGMYIMNRFVGPLQTQ